MAAWALAACGEQVEHPPAPESDPRWRLIGAATVWSRVDDPSVDPFSDTRPPEVDCDALGVKGDDFAGEPVLDVDTGLCNYVTVSQPSLNTVRPGDPLELRFWNDYIQAPDGVEDAQTVVAVMSGGELLFERTLPLPRPPVLNVWEVDSPVAIPLGQPIYLHVRNHGANQYSVLTLKAKVP